MEKNLKSFEEKLTRFSDYLSHNAYIAGLQTSLMGMMPIILVGALASLINMLRMYLTFLPDFSMVNSFTIGLYGIMAAFLIPYRILEKKGLDKVKVIAGLTSLSCFMILIAPVFDEEGFIRIEFSRFGTAGLVVSMVMGMLVSFVFDLYNKSGLSKNRTALPDYTYRWYVDSLPLFFSIVSCWLLTYVAGFDVTIFLSNLFNPLVSISETYVGFVLIQLIMIVIYAFGVSPWCMFGVMMICIMNSFDINHGLAAQGLPATQVFSYELAALWQLGGMGCTIGLNVLMATICKSKKLKVLGRACLLPSYFGINEPLVYGIPVALNPILMIPFIGATFVSSTIVYIVYKLGIMPIPVNEAVFALAELPLFIREFSIGGWRLLLMAILIIAVTTLLYAPFIKLYDKKCLEEEELKASGVSE